MALGNRVSAVMGTDGAVEEVLAASEAAGEQFWHMPLPEELRPTLDSQVADISNMGSRQGRNINDEVRVFLGCSNKTIGHNQTAFRVGVQYLYGFSAANGQHV